MEQRHAPADRQRTMICPSPSQPALIPQHTTAVHYRQVSPDLGSSRPIPTGDTAALGATAYRTLTW